MTFSTGLFVLEFLILVDAGATYIRVVDKSYIFTLPDTTSDNRRTQYAADDWCKANGTQLLEISNSDAQNVTLKFIGDYYNNGLFGWNIITNGKMNGRGWKWVNGRDINSINVEQQGQDLSKSFGFLQSTGNRFLIAASLATDKRGYICEGDSYCSRGGEYFNGRCYKNYTDTLSWFEARNQCLSVGGDLASFDFILNSQGLVVLNRTWITSSYTYWIGIQRLFWTWQGSNTEIKYSQWVEGQPAYVSNSQCVCLAPYVWKWITCDCDNIYQFICLSVINASTSQAEPSTTTTTTTTTTTKTTTTTTTSTTTTPPSPTVASLTSPMVLRPSSTEKTSTMSSAESSIAGVFSPNPEASDANPIENDRSTHLTYDAALGIGLGVGIGGGLLISAVIVACYIRARRRGWSGTFSDEKTHQFPEANQCPPDTSYVLNPIKSSQSQASTSNISAISNADSGFVNNGYDAKFNSTSLPL